MKKIEGCYFVANVAQWKQNFLHTYLTELGATNVEFVSRYADKYVIRNQFCGHRNYQLIVWGAQTPPAIARLAKTKKRDVWHLEDGFLRSKGLGADHIHPSSLILDRSDGIYYRSDKPSSLENYLATHKFTEAERGRAAHYIRKITASNLTKYNIGEKNSGYTISETAKNVIIFGQCEDDQSILFGSPKVRTNCQLIEKVLIDFPNSNIYFRPHPDVTAGLRRRLSDETQYQDRITIMSGSFPIWSNIQKFEVVCVMTSLAGFEALLRGRKVRTYGSPFYAGWGLTNDFLPCPRRNRNLSLEEVFFGAYIYAPDYIDSRTGKLSDIDKVISALVTAE
ncbi:MAG: capsular polysaccharide biosynthesis protein [Henriciella sp.]